MSSSLTFLPRGPRRILRGQQDVTEWGAAGGGRQRVRRRGHAPRLPGRADRDLCWRARWLAPPPGQPHHQHHPGPDGRDPLRCDAAETDRQRHPLGWQSSQWHHHFHPGLRRGHGRQRDGHGPRGRDLLDAQRLHAAHFGHGHRHLPVGRHLRWGQRQQQRLRHQQHRRAGGGVERRPLGEHHPGPDRGDPGRDRRRRPSTTAPPCPAVTTRAGR